MNQPAIDGLSSGTVEALEPRVRISGTGLLADIAAADIRAPIVSAAPDLVVTMSDSWMMEWPAERAACRADGVPWVPVRTELNAVVVGPMERPHVPGCVRCADSRRHRANPDPEGRRAVLDAHHETLASTPSPLLTTLAARTVAELVAADAAQLVAGGEPRTAGAIVLVDLATLRTSQHRFLPDPRCPDCTAAPRPIPSYRPQARPKPDPNTYRLRPDLNPDDLRESYVDGETGLIRELRYGTSAGLALVQAPMRLRGTHRSRHTESGYGRTRDFRTSETVAICEALERYGGLRQGEAPTVRRARYRDVADQAIDVGALGSHPVQSYQSPNFRCEPFDPDREYGWVTGYSFARRGPVLVPERLAYYGIGEEPPADPPFVLDSSNGGATGSCLEEAILHGILEVLERDAFLLTWYARLSAPRVDPTTFADPTIPLLVEQIRHEQGYRVALYDTTVEHGIPTVWAMAVRADDDTSRPKVCCTAGGHLRAERAVVSALAELGPILAGLIDNYSGESARVEEMVADPARVERMEDHGLLYGDDRVFDRFDFLNAGRSDVPASASFGADHHAIASDDLTQDLFAVTERLMAVGLEVVAVDQTTSEHAAGGLSCARVFIPGTLPMSFGHLYRRLRGLPRVRAAPVRLGHRSDPLTEAEINQHPHPFP